jgi:ferric-dicitrate binding protein FerR (iron transport regulator)
MNNKRKKNIDWSVISRNLFGQANELEKSQFEEWASASPEHQKYADESKEFYTRLEEDGIERPDSNKAIKEFHKHRSAKKTKTIKLGVVLRYAAAILLPIAVATFLVLNTNKQEEDMLASGIESIEPGSAKAELEMANGELIVLEQGDTLVRETDGTRIHNQSGLLKYQANQKLFEKETYNTLKIPRGGEYQLQLADGTKVWLNSASSFKYPTKFIGDQRIVYLSGEAYFDVAHNKEKPFIVKVEDMNVKVLGTEFNVKAYADEPFVKTTLVNGKVEVMAKGFDENVRSILTPSLQATYSKSKRDINTNQVKTSIYTAWKDGLFVLDNTKLDDLCLILSRWYDIDFFFTNERVKANTFTGKMKKYENLEDILHLLEQLSDVEFVVKDNAVVVQGKSTN